MYSILDKTTVTFAMCLNAHMLLFVVFAGTTCQNWTAGCHQGHGCHRGKP